MKLWKIRPRARGLSLLVVALLTSGIFLAGVWAQHSTAGQSSGQRVSGGTAGRTVQLTPRVKYRRALPSSRSRLAVQQALQRIDHHTRAEASAGGVATRVELGQGWVGLKLDPLQAMGFAVFQRDETGAHVTACTSLQEVIRLSERISQKGGRR